MKVLVACSDIYSLLYSYMELFTTVMSYGSLDFHSTASFSILAVAQYRCVLIYIFTHRGDKIIYSDYK